MEGILVGVEAEEMDENGDVYIGSKGRRKEWNYSSILGFILIVAMGLGETVN